jgi:hypothetical protein
MTWKAAKPILPTFVDAPSISVPPAIITALATGGLLLTARRDSLHAAHPAQKTMECLSRHGLGKPAFRLSSPDGAAYRVYVQRHATRLIAGSIHCRSATHHESRLFSGFLTYWWFANQRKRLGTTFRLNEVHREDR